jgi:hypothetical protein
MKKDSAKEANHNDLNRNNYFKVPEGYFEKLSGDISEKIAANHKAAIRKQPNMRRITLISTSAAAVIAVLIIFSVLLKRQLPPQNDWSSYQISGQAISEYLEDNVDENTLLEASPDNLSYFDADKLRDLVTPGDTVKQNKENKIIDNDTTINKNDILDYLLNEEIDPETL